MPNVAVVTVFVFAYSALLPQAIVVSAPNAAHMHARHYACRQSPVLATGPDVQ